MGPVDIGDDAPAVGTDCKILLQCYHHSAAQTERIESVIHPKEKSCARDCIAIE